MRKAVVIISLLLALVSGQAFCVGLNVGTIKNLPDETTLPRPVTGVITATVQDDYLGYVSYLEDPSRTSGIILDKAGVVGSIVDVSGILRTLPSGERYIGDSTISPGNDGLLFNPIGMTNKSIGSPIGLNTEGMVVSTWGSVTATGYDDYGRSYVYLDDGSGLLDGTYDWEGNPNKGIRLQTSYPEYFSIGDYWKVSGPVGKALTIDGLTEYKFIRECWDFPFMEAPEISAVGGNGRIFVSCSLTPCASGYVIYRSDSEYGDYSPIGRCSNSDCIYIDSPISNGVTFWYKASAVSGTTESQLSAPCSATATVSAPVVSITSVSTDDEGIVDITFNYSPGQNGSPIPMISFEIDGEEIWDEAAASSEGTWCFDGSELSPGPHTVGVRVSSSDTATKILYAGYDKKGFTNNCGIRNLFVSELTDGITPIKADFLEESDWTVTISQGETQLAQTSGTGNSIDWTWDASSSGPGLATIAISYKAKGKPGPVKNKFSTFWITLKSLLPTSGNYQWAAWYPRDQKADGYAAYYYADYFYRNNFNQPLSSYYSYQLKQASEWWSVVIDLLEETNAPATLSHLTWSGHGNFPSASTFNPDGVPTAVQGNAWMANFYNSDWWTGLGPFQGFYDRDIGWETRPIGPHIGNRAYWKKAGSGRGRVEITQMNRRFKFVAAFCCWGTRGTMSLALGIPKRQIPGCKCAFIGFHNKSWTTSNAEFSYDLFNELAKNQTLGAACSIASKRFATASPPEARLANPMILGDPNMRIGRNAP